VWQSCVVSDVLASVASWITVPDAADLMGVPLGRVRRFIEEYHLVAVKRDGILSIPAETIVDGEPLPSLHGTIIVLLDSGYSLESAVEWLYTHDDSLPGTPMEFLLKGHKSAVRRLAMMQAL
jgi:Rv2175c C-terminal domain of unknown function